MDSSRSYIRMCADAEELQNVWACGHGDVVTHDMETTCCWLPKQRPHDTVSRGYRIRRSAELVHIDRCVWLPRLDQLMELAQYPHISFDRTTQDFFRFCELPYADGPPPKQRFGSLEQMWLAFVMQRRFHKRWIEDTGWTPISGSTPL